MATSDGPLARLKAGLQPGGRIMVAALLRVGARAVETAKKAFEDQARGGTAWAPRQVPNLAGILEDAKSGSTLKERRFESRPAGLDTGTLRASIKSEVVDGRTVNVGTTVDYADKVQKGGESTITISEVQRKNLAKMVGNPDRKQKKAKSAKGQKKQENQRVLQFSKKIKLIIRGVVTSYKLKTPPRKFMAVTDQDKADYGAIMRDEIAKELKR